MARRSMHFQLNFFHSLFVQTIGQLKCRDKCVVDTLSEVVSTRKKNPHSQLYSGKLNENMQ